MEDGAARQAAERRIRVLAAHVTSGDGIARAETAADSSLVVPSSTSASSSRQYASATGKPTTYEKVILRDTATALELGRVARQLRRLPKIRRGTKRSVKRRSGMACPRAAAFHPQRATPLDRAAGPRASVEGPDDLASCNSPGTRASRLTPL